MFNGFGNTAVFRSSLGSLAFLDVVEERIEKGGQEEWQLKVFGLHHFGWQGPGV